MFLIKLFFRQIRKLDEKVKNIDSHSKNEIRKLKQQNEHLEKSLSITKIDLQNVKELNTSLSFELHNPLQKDNYDSMEISELMVINKHLKDKNDELIMQLQSITNGPDETFEEDLNFNAESTQDFNQQISLLLTQPQPESLKQECE